MGTTHDAQVDAEIAENRDDGIDYALLLAARNELKRAIELLNAEADQPETTLRRCFDLGRGIGAAEAAEQAVFDFANVARHHLGDERAEVTLDLPTAEELAAHADADGSGIKERVFALMSNLDATTTGRFVFRPDAWKLLCDAEGLNGAERVCLGLPVVIDPDAPEAVTLDAEAPDAEAPEVVPDDGR